MEESEFVEKYINPIMEKLDQILTYTQVKNYVQKDLGDLSKKQPRVSSNKFALDYNGETYVYTKDKKCKYCENHYVGWKKPYTKGDRPIAIDDDGRVLGEGCPKFN